MSAPYFDKDKANQNLGPSIFIDPNTNEWVREFS